MTRPILLLSDLHLPAQPSPLREAFLRFLQGPACAAQAVYLLGDIFEYWIGDDVGLRVYGPEIAALRQLSAQGVAVYVQRGNRDFLLGDQFAIATGARLLQDPVQVNLFGVPTLLSHGDVFCTADHGYQRWRRFAHHPLAQALFLGLPRAWRERVAGGLRGRSRRDTAMKPRDITDITPQAVQLACAHAGAGRVIHGHTHRPGEYRLPQNPEIERIVLADWRPDQMEYLELGPQGLRRRPVPAA